MKKYLISLEKDLKRRELFFSQADTADFHLFNAINTMILSEGELQQKFDFVRFQSHYQRQVTKGEIGCTLSHLAVYQLIVDDIEIKDDEYVLVCEDDALFSANFQQNLTALLATHPKQDIILVGQSKIPSFNDIELAINYPTTLKCWQNKIGDTGYIHAYPYKNYFAGTVAYLIKKSSAKHVLQELKNGLPYWLADDFILFGNEFLLDVSIIRPLMVIENPNLVSNLEDLRGSLKNNLFKKLLKFPLKKALAIKRNM